MSSSSVNSIRALAMTSRTRTDMDADHVGPGAAGAGRARRPVAGTAPGPGDRRASGGDVVAGA